MKKTIRIITSLLLVIAMLLPLGASVGAADTSDKVSAGLVQTSEDLPKLYINSSANLGETIYQSKDAKVDATAKITGAEDSKHNLAKSDIELKTRGNTTWGVLKWAYQIKFDSKVDLFDMGKAKKWILLANYYDGTFVRNKVMFDLGKEIGIPYVVESVFVDLYINGEYRGVYQLTEKVELGSSRIDIDSDYGVLLEMDATNRPAELAKEIYFQTTTTGKPFVYKEYNTDFEDDDPALVAKIREFTENHINKLEAELYSPDADWDVIESMIDVDSFIRYYFITEISMEVDATYSSTFFYIDGPGDVLHCGPLWDYDRIMGWDTSYDQTHNSDYLKNITDSTDEFRVEWFKMLFRHPEFVERVNEMYEEVVRDAFNTDKVIGMFSDYQDLLWDNLIKNYKKYGLIFHNRSYIVEDLCSGSFEDQLEFTTTALYDWLTYRNEYLETAYGKYHPTLMYQTKDIDSGWQNAYSGGCMTYQTDKITSIRMTLENNDLDGSIEYAVNKGTKLSEFAKAGEVAQLSENDKIHGIRVRLTGNLAKHFDVEYRVQRGGAWSSWKYNGDRAGGSSGNYVERIQVRLIQKKDVELGTISFVSSVGTAPAAIEGIVGNKIALGAMEVEDYTFEGWYDNADFTGEPVTTLTVSAGETKLYAKMRSNLEMGDIDGNGTITMTDLFKLKLFIKQLAIPTAEELKVADINGDGIINMLDSFDLKYRIAKGDWRE